MADDLDVSGATTAVTTEDLDAAAAQLETLSREAASVADLLGRLDPPSIPGVFFADQSRVDVELATARLLEVSHRAGLLRMLLLTAAQGYIVAERTVGLAVRGLEATAAQWLGARLASSLLMGNLFVAVGGAIWLGVAASGGLGRSVDSAFGAEGVPKTSPFLRDHNYLITNTASVAAIRTLAQSVGPALLGATGAPPGVPQLLGARAYEYGARGLIAPARTVGLLQESGVRLVQTVPGPTTRAPHDYTGRLERVPHVQGEAGPQVVIERYTVPGEADRYSVYIGGTVTFSPSSQSEPWDMTSNMSTAAGVESGAVESVRAAMAAAGVDEGSPVQFTGYSQGGATAARLAASGLYNTQGLVSFGGPTGQVPLPEGLPAVLVEHADDPVPALGGEQDNAGAVLVRRDVFGGEPLPHDRVVAAHYLEHYLETARLMDQSGSPQLDATRAALDSFTAGATMQSSTAYRFERTR